MKKGERPLASKQEDNARGGVSQSSTVGFGERREPKRAGRRTRPEAGGKGAVAVRPEGELAGVSGGEQAGGMGRAGYRMRSGAQPPEAGRKSMRSIPLGGFGWLCL